MVRQRPRRARRAPLALRIGRIAVPGLLVGLATTGVVSAATGTTTSSDALPSLSAGAPATAAREQPVSRDVTRPALASASPAADVAQVRAEQAAAAKAAREKALEAARAKAKKAAAAKKKAAEAKRNAAPPLKVVGQRYTRVDLNVRAENDPDSRLFTVLKTGAKMSVTDSVRDGWRYISYRGKGAWVKNQYLVTKKPATVKAGISAAACKGGSSVESGLTRDAVRVHRAICARYPSVKSYGGVRADSLPEHPSGRALDAMISDSGTGWAIARWVRANAKALGVSEVLYAQHIWTVQRSGEGWRTFSDRGSATANHYDHVHVTVYGNSGG